jgi:hypothetical protein
MIDYGSAIVASHVSKPFPPDEEPCWKDARKPRELIVIVVTLLTYGCPIQAIVHAFELDERTVASWRDRAGKHCQQVHEAVIQQGQLERVTCAGR